jgi:hypothetical protein
MARHPFFGATGRFPKGKLNPSDEGELQFGVTTVHSEIRIDFGKPVAWLTLPPETARQLAQVLVDRADAIEGKTS